MDNLSTTLSTLSLSTGNHNLDNLNEDIYHFYLFNYLDIDEILNLKLVSKSIRSIVNAYDIKELALVDDSGRRHNWFSTTMSTALRCQIDISKFDSLTKPAKYLLNLKYLRIEKAEFNSLSIKCNYLNQFSKLRILEIEKLDLVANDPLKLPELRALSIALESNCYVKEGTSLFLITPNLRNLYIHQHRATNLIDSLIGIRHPLSIKYLKLNSYDKGSIALKNLECLELDDMVNLNSDVLKFAKLKKLKILCPDRRKLNSLFEAKKDDLEIILGGVKMKQVCDEVSESPDYNSLEYQLSNYAELEDGLNFVTFIDYDKLTSLLPKQPADLFKKYSNVQMLEIHNKIEDENQLINFIRKLPNLCTLKADISSFNDYQQFFDQLSTISSLTSLNVYGKEYLNFDFIMRFEFLTDVYTEQAVQMTANLNLNNLKYFKEFRMQIRRNNRITVFKKGADRYYVDNCKWLVPLNHEDFTFEDVIEWSQMLVNNLNDKMSDHLREPHRKLRMSRR